MTRLHFVKKSRKAYKASGINKGESYYWWKFNFSSVRRSKSKPRRSQLTRSEYYAKVYSAEESLQDAVAQAENEMHDDDGDNESFFDEGPKQTVMDAIEEIISSLEELKSDMEEKESNLESNFPSSNALVTIQERLPELDDLLENLGNVKDEIDGATSMDDIASAIGSLPWPS